MRPTCAPSSTARPLSSIWWGFLVAVCDGAQDGDGDLEVIVGTSLGFIYVLRASTGQVLPGPPGHAGDSRSDLFPAGFPLVMSEIQAQVTVADVNADGVLEMIAVDNKGNVMCFSKSGKEVWETQVSGFVAQGIRRPALSVTARRAAGATFGDVDGDGQLDVIVVGWACMRPSLASAGDGVGARVGAARRHRQGAAVLPREDQRCAALPRAFGPDGWLAQGRS